MGNFEILRTISQSRTFWDNKPVSQKGVVSESETLQLLGCRASGINLGYYLLSAKKKWQMSICMYTVAQQDFPNEDSLDLGVFANLNFKVNRLCY